MKLIFLAIILAFTLSASEHVPANAGLPLVAAGAPICPHFENHPCTRMRCDRREA